MNILPETIFIIICLVSTISFLKGIYESKYKNNSYGQTPFLYGLGIFVWADAVVLGLFWLLSTVTVLILKDWKLFLLIFSVFWLVRSLGETIYWLNQQFSTKNLNPSKRFFLYKLFRNDSIWFIHQLFWQCITVISIIFTIYFAHSWIISLK